MEGIGKRKLYIKQPYFDSHLYHEVLEVLGKEGEYLTCRTADWDSTDAHKSMLVEKCFIGSDDDLMSHLRGEIHYHLGDCKGDHNTPQICRMIETPKGKQDVIRWIVDYVVEGGMTIAEAILHVEHDFNVNKTDL